MRAGQTRMSRKGPSVPTPEKATPRPRRRHRWLKAGGLLLLLTIAGWLAWTHAPSVFLDREALLDYLQRQGSRAPLVLMALQAAQVVLAPIPGHLLAAVSGFAFGPWRGTLYTAVGVGVGGSLVMVLSRLAGRPLVERLAPQDALLRVDHWAARRGPIFFFLFFMLPFLPDDLACFAVGLSSLPLLPMLGLVILARLPGHFAAAWIGATATGLHWIWWVAFVGIAGLLFGAYWRHRARIESWLLKRLESSDRQRSSRGDSA